MKPNHDDVIENKRERLRVSTQFHAIVSQIEDQETLREILEVFQDYESVADKLTDMAEELALK